MKKIKEKKHVKNKGQLPSADSKKVLDVLLIKYFFDLFEKSPVTKTSTS